MVKAYIEPPVASSVVFHFNAEGMTEDGKRRPKIEGFTGGEHILNVYDETGAGILSTPMPYLQKVGNAGWYLITPQYHRPITIIVNW